MIIKFSKANITKRSMAAVSSVLRSGWLTHGRYTKLFEDKFCKFTKSRYSITVSSCTAGLHLICLALGFKKGDEVIVPAMTHTATAHAVEYTGAKPIFTDITDLTGNIKLEDIKRKFNKKTKGIIVVHMAGYPCEIDKIADFCKLKKIKLIEDCAHSVGSYNEGIHLGNFGDAAAFSFYPTKQITTGEGGMVTTNDKKISKKIRMLKAFGINKDINQRKKQGEYQVTQLGFNYRLTDFQSALGYFQIQNYRKNLEKRHKIAKLYYKNFKNCKKISQVEYSKKASYFIYQIFCNKNKRDKILNILKKNNIGVSVHYRTPVPLLLYYKKKYKIKKNEYLFSQKYSQTNISLPVYPSLKTTEINKISNLIIKFA